MHAADERNLTFAHIHPEVVTKPDGRYLIYYSWPSELDGDVGDEDAAETDRRNRGGATTEKRARQPTPQPWSPQGGPADE